MGIGTRRCRPLGKAVNHLVQAAIEILLLAVAIYAALRFLRSTRGFGVARGLVVLLGVAWIGVAALDLLIGVPRLHFIVNSIGPTLVLVLIILFQPELRRGISRLGEGGMFGLLDRDPKTGGGVAAIAQAALWMSRRRTGALLVIERRFALDAFAENGVELNALLTAPLLESLFHPGSPLHDGACIVRGGRLLAARCVLPLSDNPGIADDMGTRHRAALGITEETDCITLTISEETGRISLAHAGAFDWDIPEGEVEVRLRRALQAAADTDEKESSTALEPTPDPATGGSN